ncbi:hypothetical protein CAC42_1580 [Sphaceloma murrayae]|uniref:DUF2415 domain-containing protein n=1 Tax=Sphaceloma murrayae TaxID=2082308 RepID=A0A2K1R361_9PEZI|nr:hypothetical protein CAC42_1580 [Sphaceloma murrayae]
MAVDPVVYPDSDNLAHAGKTFYPLKIPVSHWQLRHYISHPDPDVLYYASGSDIYYLNTATKKRKHIATLPFDARCTSAGFGYLCIGGENDGHFAVVKLEESRAADVDAAIPFDYWQSHRGAPRAADIKVETVGTDIVNSVSVHQIHDDEAHLHDVVAVLTNNDRTVRIYSLIHSIEAAVLQLPDPMNHATISPDGTTLAAVGDVNNVYLFKRSMHQDPPQIPKPHNRLNMSAADWTEVARYPLYIPGTDNQKGYFTTTWSSSGHLLAVGSEAGYITVFDMIAFEESGYPTEIEAVRLVTVPSSRPDFAGSSWPGAVRSMLFVPDPWDLLIWAEDQGRICIGDLRTGLKKKQVINLDPKDVTLHKIDVEDLEPDENPEDARRLLELEEEYIRRRMRDQEVDVNSIVTDGQVRQRDQRYLRLGSRLGDRPFSALGNDPQGLTADEQRILESLRTSRQREEELSRGALPTSVNYTSSSLFDGSQDRRRDDHSAWPPLQAGAVASTFQEPSRLTSRHEASSGGQRDNLSPSTPAIRGSAHDMAAAQMETLLQQTRERTRQLQAHQRDRVSPNALAVRDSTNDDEAARMQVLRQPDDVPSYMTTVRDSAHNLAEAQMDALLQQMRDRARQFQIRQESSLRASRPIPPHARLHPDNPRARQDDDEGPWRVISNAMNLARGPLFEGSTAEPNATEERELSDHRRALIQQRERLRNLQRNLDASASSARGDATDANAGFQSRYELLREGNRDAARGFEAGWELLRRRSVRRTGVLTQLSGMEVGVRTAGLAISRDGRTVWAATEEGVFEIGLRFDSRGQWAAVEML